MQELMILVVIYYFLLLSEAIRTVIVVALELNPLRISSLVNS
jgi:hypothetical protein